jgi:hypothetical protein
MGDGDEQVAGILNRHGVSYFNSTQLVARPTVAHTPGRLPVHKTEVLRDPLLHAFGTVTNYRARGERFFQVSFLLQIFTTFLQFLGEHYPATLRAGPGHIF